jgi:aspartate/methionine/tyrosine aminotransferase
VEKLRVSYRQYTLLLLIGHQKDIALQGVQVVLASNPRNPTGQVIKGQKLKDLVELSTQEQVTMIFDEV